VKKRKTLATPQDNKDHDAFAAELEEQLRAEGCRGRKKYIAKSSFK
jgi:hypothetical protein